MSKPVRIKDYVASRVEELAVGERRSFANMVEVLLLAAIDGRGGLTERNQGRKEVAVGLDSAGSAVPVETSGTESLGSLALSSSRSVSPSAEPATLPEVVVTGRAHMKKNRPAIQCGSREFVDGVCVECGALA